MNELLYVSRGKWRKQKIHSENFDLFVCVVDATVEYCTTINIFSTEIVIGQTDHVTYQLTKWRHSINIDIEEKSECGTRYGIVLKKKKKKRYRPILTYQDSYAACAIMTKVTSSDMVLW